MIAKVQEYEREVNEATKRATENHVMRLMKDSCDPQGGIIYTDITIDLERCSDHGINLVEALE